MEILHRGEDKLGRRIELSIIFEGKDITKDISDSIISCNYRDSINEFDTAELTLHDREGFWIGSWAPQKGDKMEMRLKLINWSSNSSQEYSIGSFYIDSINYSGSPDIVSLRGISVNLESNIMDGKENNSWEQVTFKKIVEDIASKCELELMCDFDFDRVYGRVEQDMESDFSLLKRLCQEAGINIKLYSDKLILFEDSKYENREAVYKVIKNENCLDYSFSMDDSDTYDGCTLSYYDVMLDKQIEESFIAKQRPGYKRETKRILFIKDNKTPPGETAEQKKAYLLPLAQKALREKNKNGITGKLDIFGIETLLSSGDVIEVSGFGRFDNRYLITEVTTDFEQYRHSLSIRQVLEDY